MTIAILIILLAVALVFLSREHQINEILREQIGDLINDRLERHTTGDIVFDDDIFRIEYISHYDEESDSWSREEFEGNLIQKLLVQHFFNTPSWDERGFRSDADTRGIYNIVITKVDKFF